MKPTSGPWTTDRLYDGPAVFVKGADGLTTARCGHPERNKLECEANARLIAATPEMYEYIKEKAYHGDAQAARLLEAIHAS